MKKLTAIAFLITSFTVSSYAQDAKTKKDEKIKATYQVGAAKITVIESKGDVRQWNNYQIEKVNKSGDKMTSSNGFTEKELADVKAVIDKALAEEKAKK